MDDLDRDMENWALDYDHKHSDGEDKWKDWRYKAASLLAPDRNCRWCSHDPLLHIVRAQGGPNAKCGPTWRHFADEMGWPPGVIMWLGLDSYFLKRVEGALEGMRPESRTLPTFPEMQTKQAVQRARRRERDARRAREFQARQDEVAAGWTEHLESARPTSRGGASSTPYDTGGLEDFDGGPFEGWREHWDGHRGVGL